MQSSTDEGAFRAASFRTLHVASTKRQQAQPSPVGYPLPSDWATCSPSSCGSHTSAQTALLPPKKRARLPQQHSTASLQHQQQQKKQQRGGPQKRGVSPLRARLPPNFLALTLVVPASTPTALGEQEEARSPPDPSDPSPMYLGTSKLPVDGWFQSCRCERREGIWGGDLRLRR